MHVVSELCVASILLQHYTSQHFGKEVEVLICSAARPFPCGCLIWEVMIIFDIAAVLGREMVCEIQHIMTRIMAVQMELQSLSSLDMLELRYDVCIC